MFCFFYLRHSAFMYLHVFPLLVYINLFKFKSSGFSRAKLLACLGLSLGFIDFPISEIHSVGDSQFPHLSNKSIVDHNGIQHHTFPIHKTDKENGSRDS